MPQTHYPHATKRDAAIYDAECAKCLPRWGVSDVRTWDLTTLDVVADSEQERAREARERGDLTAAAQHMVNARELDRIRAARLDAMADAMRDPNADVGAMLLREFAHRSPSPVR